MGIIGRFVVYIVANIVAILLADFLLAGFSFTGDFLSLIGVSALLAAIQIFIRPVLKLLFGPLIVLTLGFFAFVINIFILLLLDFLSDALTIEGYLAFIIATILVSLVHVLMNGGDRNKAKD